MDERPRDLKFRFLFGQFKTSILKFEYGLAECFSFFHVLQGLRKCKVHMAQRTNTDRKSLPRQLVHQLIKTLARFKTQNISFRDKHIVKK